MQSNTTWPELMNPWSKLWLETGTQAWQTWRDCLEKTGAGAFPPLTQKLQENQATYFNLLQGAFQTWQALWPKVEAGENGQTVINQYLQEIQRQLQGSGQAVQDLQQLWQLYAQEAQKLNQLWLQAALSSLQPLSQVQPGQSQPWIELNNLYWNLLYEESFGSLTRSPILGPSREISAKLLQGFDSWTALYRATTDYQLLLGQVQYQSLERLMAELVQRAQQGKTPKDWRTFQQVWSETADLVFETAFCQPENLKIRGRFINSLNRYRLCQQALMEEGLKQMNLPTRTEVDEIHQTIYQLKKEVKALKQRLAVYEPSAL
ncbi:MAG: class III poly(R)-hydroxyalkanoic acid synthase subunit PhaE [Cyanobacteria bacterium RI_101]|nr:class III poly(R)-hydroxyalkanoic acid synthase subunit PhaE [Cyanobacteria bacterium RI_101]